MLVKAIVFSASLFITVSNAHSITITKAFEGYLNDHRQSIGLAPLILDPDMNVISKAHSTNMASKKIAFGHSGFSARCTAARKALGGGNLCAENVAMGQTSGKTVFNAWMNSSGHRKNIENPRVTHIGFGYTKSSAGKYYWTNLFLQR